MVKRFLIPLVFLQIFSSAVAAHEIRPAFLMLKEQTSGAYSVLWKVPRTQWCIAGNQTAIAKLLPERIRAFC